MRDWEVGTCHLNHFFFPSSSTVAAADSGDGLSPVGRLGWVRMSMPALLQELSQLKSWSFEGMLETGMTSIFGSS